MIACPNCNLTGYHRVVWGPRNLVALGFNVVFGLAQFVFLVWTEWGIPLKRKCFRCGCTFSGGRFRAPDFAVCARCSYDLTGNVSGRCPECGWKLPRRYRAYYRMIERKDRRVRRAAGRKVQPQQRV
ncbi:MAG: hypothetical protein IH988_01575 [Planctomycetes bacterium]|nr:hypothetical protein [Planctomycetota bacterium]